MTKIQINKKNNLIVGFVLTGHTQKDIYGKDVLCAAISTLTQSTCLGILKVLNVPAKYEKNEKKGFLKLDLTICDQKQIEKSQVLLETMLKSIEDISVGNEKYMKVEVYDEIH